MQHISDEVIYTDGINQKKWVCCNKCKKTFHLCCVTQEKEENIKFPFLCRFNECRKEPKVQVGRSRPQAGNQVGNFFIPSGETKNNTKEDKESEGWQDYPPPHTRKQVAGEGSKEQLWKVEKLEEAFDLWEKNKQLPPKERLSMNKISKMTGIPYTTLNERLSGRRGGGHRGKIMGGKWTAKVVKAGKFKQVTSTDFKQVTMQAGNHPLDHLYNPPSFISSLK